MTRENINEYLSINPKTDLGKTIIQARNSESIEFNGWTRSIGPDTKLYTIIGIGHKETRARFFHESLNTQFAWDLVHLEPVEIFDFEAAMEDIAHFQIRGVTVTMPYKERAYQFISENGRFGNSQTQTSGAVNTIINEGGKFTGWNTDIDGFIEASLKAGIDLSDTEASIVGCGGMGRAALTGLCEHKARFVRLFDVNTTKAHKLAREFQSKYPHTKIIANNSIEECLHNSRYVIQCSPVGMMNDKNLDNIKHSAIPSLFLRRNMAVLDAVYVPLETIFITGARRIGCSPIILGINILVYGGIKQIQHYLGFEVPFTLIPTMVKTGEKAVMSVLQN